MLKKFCMKNYNIKVTPTELKIPTLENDEEQNDGTLYKQMFGSLRYLCNCRPDISFSIRVLVKFMHQPRKKHVLATKKVLRYTKGTLDFGIIFPKIDQV